LPPGAHLVRRRRPRHRRRHAAGCQTVAVSYGYLGDGGPLHTWGADLIIDHPAELTAYLNRCVAPK
jgi:phosphoglycolate phosphatase